ncbi:hypothetical protein GCM10010166_20480 [Couchioplanes caeruleus subsp. azureus]|nr:hypothetical protein GCM10010166_20480 [Couchioplanes caeruleus subsp. azureus]
MACRTALDKVHRGGVEVPALGHGRAESPRIGAGQGGLVRPGVLPGCHGDEVVAVSRHGEHRERGMIDQSILPVTGGAGQTGATAGEPMQAVPTRRKPTRE